MYSDFLCKFVVLSGFIQRINILLTRLLYKYDRKKIQMHASSDNIQYYLDDNC